MGLGLDEGIRHREINLGRERLGDLATLSRAVLIVFLSFEIRPHLRLQTSEIVDLLGFEKLGIERRQHTLPDLLHLDLVNGGFTRQRRHRREFCGERDRDVLLVPGLEAGELFAETGDDAFVGPLDFFPRLRDFAVKLLIWR